MEKADGGDGSDPLQRQRDLYHAFEAKKPTSVAEKKPTNPEKWPRAKIV